jgi:hypothetical protein
MENQANFRPLANIIIYARLWLFDSVAGLWYVLNIILHLLAVALLFLLVRKQSDETTAILAALLFGLYFQHFEAVLWLYGIIRLMAAICILAAMISYQKALVDLNFRSVIASYLFFFMGLLCVEDTIFLSLYFVAGVLLYSSNLSKRRLLRYGAGFVVFTGLYVIVRVLLMERTDVSTAYFYWGGHIVKNIFAYLSWIVMPSLNHPYILPFMKQYAPNLLFLATPLEWLAFAFMILISIVVIRNSNVFRRQMLIFIFVSLIPVIFMDSKVSTKLVYIPSIGVTIMAASLLRQYVFKPDRRRNILLISILIIYLGLQSSAIMATIFYYRATQKTVATLLDEIGELNINWNNYDYLLFDNVPGRARLGNAFKYRFKSSCRLIDKYNQSENQFDLFAERQRLKDADTSYIMIDFASGHPILIDSFSNK